MLLTISDYFIIKKGDIFKNLLTNELFKIDYLYNQYAFGHSLKDSPVKFSIKKDILILYNIVFNGLYQWEKI